MNKLPTEKTTSRWLIRLGVLLFFLGLLTGLFTPNLSNPRMGLTSHVIGLMSGTFLVILGLIWSKLRLSRTTMVITFWLAIYSTYASWAIRLAAAAWGAGGSILPMASLGHKGSPLQEGIIKIGILLLVPAMLLTCIIVLWGLRGVDESKSKGTS
jgi:hydroxylaminobenzene mutase